MFLLNLSKVSRHSSVKKTFIILSKHFRINNKTKLHQLPLPGISWQLPKIRLNFLSQVKLVEANFLINFEQLSCRMCNEY